MKELIISSSMFMNNGWMPDECSGYGNDISPDIRVEDIPDGTQTLAIILDDLDHPVIPEFNHWIFNHWIIKYGTEEKTDR